MKITGKKLLAVLCTVVMLVTTIVPSLAFTASAADTTYSYTFTSKQFDANGSKTLGGVNWTLAGTNGDYWGYDGTKGQQFGSSKKPYKSMTLTSASFDNVTKITIETSGASSVNASFTVSVGGTQVGSSTKITATNTPYSFEPTTSLSGAVQFSYTQTSSKALYIKSITIEYSASSSCNHANTEEKTTPASCTTAGSTTVTCKDCGATISTETINATGHKYGDWEITKEPICEDGEHQKTCSTCGDILTEKLTAEHNYENGICTMCNEKEPSEATITFDDKSKRTEFTTTVQVWEENGIKVTNNKASATSDVGDYAAPARFYKNSQIIIECSGKITKIVFDCAKNTSEFCQSIGSSATMSNDIVTVTLDGTSNTFTINLTAAQVQLDSITVYFVHEHSYDKGVDTAPTYDEQGYTTYTCATCGHTYTDNYTDKLEKIVISKSCIVLKEAININFLISDSILVDGRDYVAVIKKGDTVVAEIPYSEWTSNGSYKVITYTGIVAKQMADLYTVVIYDGELKASDERIDGVTEYVKRAIEAGVFTNPENVELATLLVDMLNYGAAAQIQWNYNTDNLANAIVADYQSFATQTEVTFGEDIATNASENYGSTTASLKDRVILNFNFKEGTLEGAAKAIISYTDHYGNEVSYEIAAEDFGTSKGRIIIAVDKLVAADARCIVTCIFVDANGDEIDGIYAQDSIANYCARAIKYYGAGTADANIYESIMKYADAAATYFVEQ